MTDQLLWDEAWEGMEVSPLTKVATTQMLQNGNLEYQWLVQLVTDWMGEEGTLKKLSYKSQTFDYPKLTKTMTEPNEGETWRCKGKVTKKYLKDDEALVECDIWVENEKGEVRTPAKATVVLPHYGFEIAEI